MTVKEMYEEAVKNGWENLPVITLVPGKRDYYGNIQTLATTKAGEIVHRDKDFWEGIPYEFISIL